MIRIGLSASEGIQCFKGYIGIESNAQLIFMGSATLSKGICIRIDSGEITIGDHFFCNANCFMRCTNKIEFGNDVLLGWNVHFNTFDGHKISENKNKTHSNSAPICIGGHVWIASDTRISKGSAIPSGCIVAQCSLVTKIFMEENALVGGVPAQIIKSGIYWER